jgi:hypothetical protein
MSLIITKESAWKIRMLGWAKAVLRLTINRRVKAGLLLTLDGLFKVSKVSARNQEVRVNLRIPKGD